MVNSLRPVGGFLMVIYAYFRFIFPHEHQFAMKRTFYILAQNIDQFYSVKTFSFLPTSSILLRKPLNIVLHDQFYCANLSISSYMINFIAQTSQYCPTWSILIAQTSQYCPTWSILLRKPLNIVLHDQFYCANLSILS